MRPERMIRNLLLCMLLFAVCGVRAQTLSVKSNVLYDATSTLNLGFEVTVAPQWTVEFSANYNPWTFSENSKIKHYLLQPEARWWLWEPMNGHFFGSYAQWGEYNIGNVLGKKYRYEGWIAGAGVSYGYHWILGRRWGLEATLGLGYARFDYDCYECARCGRRLEADVHKNYFGLTKAGITLIFVIK